MCCISVQQNDTNINNVFVSSHTYTSTQYAIQLCIKVCEEARKHTKVIDKDSNEVDVLKNTLVSIFLTDTLHNANLLSILHFLHFNQVISVEKYLLKLSENG